jgi:hypothetical protein
LEDTRVNAQRFLALVLIIAIAYTVATFEGQALEQSGLGPYIARPLEQQRERERHSHFWLGLYGALWVEAMSCWWNLAAKLVSLKPHKRLQFRRGLQAKSLIQSLL